MENSLYMLTIDLDARRLGGHQLHATMNKVLRAIPISSDRVSCLYAFKITGEAKMLAVLKVSDVIGLEEIVETLVEIGNTDVTCRPLKMYKKYVGKLEMLPSGTKPSADADMPIQAFKQIFVLEFDIKYPDTSDTTLDKVMVTLTDDFELALKGVDAGILLGIFKIVAGTKVVAFILQTPDELDTTLFKVPLMKQMGSGVTIYCRAVQRLNDYFNNYAMF